MRELLLISYRFPPVGGSGVQRAAKLARYLPDAGWRAHVICGGHRHAPVHDESLLSDVDPRFVHPVRGWEPGGIACSLGAMLGHSAYSASVEDRIYWRIERLATLLPLPELELPWVPAAMACARRIIRDRPIEAVVTTSPPHASHLVGRALKRRMKIPWIADLRDPIVDNFALDRASRIQTRYAAWMERLVMREADRVIVTCPELAERLAKRYGRESAGRLITIPNGYDPADRPALQPRRGGRFTLTHVGAFYRQQSIEPILIALRNLLAVRPDMHGALQFRVVGTLSGSQRAFVRAGDAAFMTQAGYRSHAEAISEMAAADVLLLTVPAVDGGQCCIPAKTFEYLGFGGHILAFAHEGTGLAATLHEAGGCTVLRDCSPAAWLAAIEAAFDAWRCGTLIHHHRSDIVERFRRDRQAVLFAKAVEGVVDPGSRLRLADADFSSTEAA